MHAYYLSCILIWQLALSHGYFYSKWYKQLTWLKSQFELAFDSKVVTYTSTMKEG